ncbi:MAG: hypothetical protein ACKO0N_00595 [Planctomycetota bacterium]
MTEWLYTLRGRLTSSDSPGFHEYRLFSGFAHISEVVTLDSMLCRDLIDELQAEDWQHNVHEDYRTHLFRCAEYLMERQPLDPSLHQVIAARESPAKSDQVPNGFVRCGHDIVDSYVGNSTLTNCGPIPEAFSPSEVNGFGLLDDRERAFAVRDAMRSLQPDDPHLGRCEVWLLARRLPEQKG